jgi:pantothenate kinase-related protein Tda10
MAQSEKSLKVRKPSAAGKAAATRIKDTHTEELVIAICGPIGSGHHSLSSILHKKLSEFGYEVEIVKLSKIIEERAGKSKKKPRYDRITDL